MLHIYRLFLTVSLEQWNKVFRKYSENIHLSLLYDGIANVKIYAIVVPIVP